MNCFIEQFYYGNLDPQTRTLRNGSHEAALLQRLCDLEDKLDDLLTGDDNTIFRRYVDTYSELLSISACDGFVNGFRLGARFAVDAFVNEDAPFGEME